MTFHPYYVTHSDTAVVLLAPWTCLIHLHAPLLLSELVTHCCEWFHMDILKELHQSLVLAREFNFASKLMICGR